MSLSLRRTLIALVWLVIVPAAASAQATIAGVVRDTSGAVLPGVTIEATSPALIEKVRSVVTDGSGQYEIAVLPAGTYVVTFTLPGFSSVRREGVQLEGTFTATINAELRVGAVEETITVAGESPTVDVQSTTRQRVMDREIIDTIPAGSTPYELGILIPGVEMARGVPDVGGSGGVGVGEQPGTGGSLRIHGGANQAIMQNGVLAADFASLTNNPMSTNRAATQEVVFDVGAVSAELPVGGVRINVIPRDGGNTFTGTIYANFTNDSLQSNNFDDRLAERGVTSGDSVRRIWEFNPGIGGPIRRDRLWFFAATKFSRAENYAAGMYTNRNYNNPNVWTYEADLSQPAINSDWQTDGQLRLAWQVTQRNKLGFLWHDEYECACQGAIGPTVAPEASLRKRYPVQRAIQLDWTAPLTNRILLEASALSMYGNTFWSPMPGLSPAMIAVTEQSTGLRYRSGDGSDLQQYRNRPQWTLNSRAVASYITGTHNIKVGMTLTNGYQDEFTYANSPVPVAYRFNNGIPNQITEFARPYTIRTELDRALGLFAQDKWTIRRLTFTYGMRIDTYKNSWPAQRLGPTYFTPNRDLSFPAGGSVDIKDFTPKAGLAYDVFGDGRTAVKVSLNKYVNSMGGNTGLATGPNPLNNIVQETTRAWNDANRNYVPDCDLRNPAANAECGALANPNLGLPRPPNTYDPDILTGWGTRPYFWEFSGGVQHEILARTSVDVSYFRRWYGNFQITDNLAVGPNDYTRFDILAPVDSRLPGSGGYQISAYDLNPNKFGVPADNFITDAKKYGKQQEHWNGVDLTMSARPDIGVMLQGGLSTGRAMTDVCDLLTKVGPEILFAGAVQRQPQHCHQEQKFLTQVKFLGSYTIPRVDVLLSGSFRSTPGPLVEARYNAPNAIIAPVLGRNLSGNAANRTIRIIDPGTITGDRLYMTDLRVAKIVRYAGARATLQVDFYNAFNANPVVSENPNYGAFRQPNNILQARLVKFGVTVDF